jgi:peroxiredoxin
MKTFQLSLLAMLLLGLATSAFAQNAAQDHLKALTDDMRKMYQAMQTPAGQQKHREESKQAVNFSWDNNTELLARQVRYNADLREGIGISAEQFQKIQDSAQISEPLQAINDARNKISEEYPGVDHGENTPEEVQKQYSELYERMQATIRENLTNGVINNVTPDQMQKVREFQISTMSEAVDFISPGMFEALGISDAQKEQFGKIRQKMEPDFDKLIDKHSELGLTFSQKTFEELDKLNGISDMMEWENALQEIQSKIRTSDREVLRITNEFEKSGKELADKLKIEMFDVLTDEQWKRMVDLIDNPPDYVKAILKKLQERRGVSGPGPNSWKPGDPIPEGYRQQRREGRFPRVNQSE